MTDPDAPAFAASPRPRALVLGLLAGVAATIVLSALAAPPVFTVLERIAPGGFAFQRVLRRVAMLFGLGALVLGLRRAGVRRLTDIGLGWTPSRRRTLALSVLVGAGAIALAFATELALGDRQFSWGELDADAIVSAIVGAAAIGLLEEGVCRGALLFPFGRLRASAFWLANAVVSSLYALAHFARGGGRMAVVDWSSGWSIWAALPAAAIQHAEAWLGLFATGVLFYLLAARQGHAWGTAGLHAGAVLAIQLFGRMTEPVEGRGSLFFADGLLPGAGLTVAIAVVITAILWRAGGENADERGRLWRAEAPPLLVVAAIALVALTAQGDRGIWEPDEGYYTAVAVSMLQHHDLLTPRIGNVLFFDKPPLVYWSLAAGITATPGDEWGFRLIHLIWFAGTTLLVAGLARSLLGAAYVRRAAAIYGLALLPCAAAAVVTPDTALTFAVTAMLACGWAWLREERPGRRGLWLVLAGAATALGVLAKGPALLIFSPPLALAAWWTKSPRGRWRAWPLALALAAGCVVGSSWYFAVPFAHPGGLDFVLYNQVTGRLGGGGFKRNATMIDGLKIYGSTLLAGLLPWGLPLVWPRRERWRELWAATWSDERLRFALAWSLLPLVVLFAARSRLPLYLLPLAPAAALLVARATPPISRRRLVTTAVLLAVVKLALSSLHVERDTRTVAHALESMGVARSTPIVAYYVKRCGLAFYGYDLTWIPTPTERHRFFQPPDSIAAALSPAQLAGGFVVVTESSATRDLDGELASLGRDCRRGSGPFDLLFYDCRTATADAAEALVSERRDELARDRRQPLSRARSSRERSPSARVR